MVDSAARLKSGRKVNFRNGINKRLSRKGGDFVSFKMGALGTFTLKGYERNLDERLERGQTLK